MSEPIPTTIADDPAKAAAVEQWTADPCGSTEVEAEIGSPSYFANLDAMRHDYAPWMDEVLGYAETSGLRVLDIGCGQGIDLVRYARAGAIVTGIDLTPRHAEIARAHLSSAGLEGTVVQGDAESLPFDSGSFDRVSSNGVLHHTPGIEPALKEANRVLKSGGEARIVLYNKSSLHYWLNQVLFSGLIKGGLRREGSMDGVLSTGVEESSIGARPLVNVYTPKQTREMLERAGFVDVRSEVAHFHVDDAFLYRRLAMLAPKLRDPRTLERVGRRAGWYVTGIGRRAS
jgi:ubiquinone/menaquinone biosynthesis C-methylase UbiE